ncbi:ABC transporter ATP-binding protein [Cellulomonas marina]|uniref:Branched-chain amino acid transport system ATP-binding protein n=1 Tax=Cellulomonas marina TaxID=988821 RepID=A0A1I0YH00_9CELL|nr:ABC transporter ATP-binding protein [Cellulomonas marina]GIG28687.1 ABC transporter ATP-binding protein [Cellulomonas marina]SFB12491.1 branched-chain amino acid transport system ATP-binding protein [Cellulomonas marina]
MPLLELKDLTVSYGRIEAVRGISLTVEEGELVTLIGANGAGKTTTMRAVSGVRPLSRGSVWFDGQDIARVKAHDRVNLGIVQAPEGRGVFPGMTVLENLEMGCYSRTFPTRAAHDEMLEHVLELFPRLRERKDQLGGTLSGGEQQMVAIGRALMARPRLLLLDEPSMGLAPLVIQQIFRIISEINGEGTTILLVEQNAQQALSRSHRAYILETGEVIKTGAGKDLLADPAVKEAYLGVA